MQETYKQIFEMAKKEVPFNVFDFGDEIAVIFKGFRISLKSKEYSWKDVRFDGMYEPVDPIITEKVIELGFVKALTLVGIHNDQEKVLEINRKVERIEKEIEYWVIKATEAYAKCKRKSTDATKESKTTYNKSYEKSRRLFEKKRRILKEEKEAVIADRTFYESRIRSFKE